MFQLLITFTFQETANPAFGMTTNVVSFQTRAEADIAYDNIVEYYPKNAIYADVVKLY